MKKKYLSMTTFKIPVLVALVMAMTLPTIGNAAAYAAEPITQSAVVSQYTPQEVASFLNSTNEITVSFPNGVTMLAATPKGETKVPASQTKQQYVAGILEKEFGKSVLCFNPFTNKAMTDPLYGAIVGNKNVMDKVLADPQKYKDLSSDVFSDMTGGEWYGHLVCLGVYSGMISGYPNGEFGGGNAVTIGEFGTIMARSEYTKATLDDYDAIIKKDAASGVDYYGWENQWWVSGVKKLGSKVMPEQWGFGDSRNQSVADIYGSSSMSRGDVAYAIASYYFADELDAMIIKIGGDMWGKGGGTMPSNMFSDANKINPKTTRKAIVAARDASENGARFTDFELYRDCIAHPENGIPVNYLAAMTILRDKGIMNGIGDNKSAWMNTVTRGETLQFLANVGVYRSAK